MKTFFRVLKNFLISQDEALSCLIRMNGEYGTPDEMLSARAWRLRESYPRLHVWINRLFFLDPNHCEEAYKAEKARRDLPTEYQQQG